MIWAGLLMGLGGTIAMDLWALVLDRTGVASKPNWAGPGRWVANLPTLFHNDIGALPEARAELALGWALHYGVGLAYGVIWAAIGGAAWLASPTFLPVWIFAVITISAGWFLLQPGMGQGWAASKTPNPWKVRGLGLVAHTVFAFGMWAVALVL